MDKGAWGPNFGINENHAPFIVYVLGVVMRVRCGKRHVTLFKRQGVPIGYRVIGETQIAVDHCQALKSIVLRCSPPKPGPQSTQVALAERK